LVYNIQEAEAESDSDNDSDHHRHSRHSSRRAGGLSNGLNHLTGPASRGLPTRKRMSILSNTYVEVPVEENAGEFADFAGFDPHRPIVRRFFDSVNVPAWDEQERGDKGMDNGHTEREKVIVEDGSDEDMDADDV
jgi:hypothetical protein